jgi:hypothetical protein
MGAVFANAPNEPAVVAIYVMPIYFDAPCKYCRNGRRATMNVRPVDYIGHPMGDFNVCTPHAEQRIARVSANEAWKSRSGAVRFNGKGNMRLRRSRVGLSDIFSNEGCSFKFRVETA